MRGIIEIQLQDKSLFIGHSRRTIDICGIKGIRAVIGRLTQAPEDKPVIQALCFDDDKWTKDAAGAWKKEHEGYTLDSLVMLYKENDISIDTDKKIIKYFRGKVVRIDKENHIASVCVSTEDIDRDKEIIPLSSWQKRKKFYEEHPVMLSSHDYYSLRSQIGEAVKINWKDMEFDFKWYAGEGNPEADWGWKLAEKGIAMFSVGFIPHSRLMGDAIPEKYKEKNPRAILPDNELLEVSQVVVGSNRGALQLGMDTPGIEQCQYAMEVIKSFSGDIPDFNAEETTKTPTPAPAKPEEQPKEKITPDSVIIAPLDIKNMKELQEIFEIWKTGEIISDKNKKLIKESIAKVQSAIDALNNLLELTNPKKEGGEKFNPEDYIIEGNKLIKKP